jgi:hypothetical protein
MAIYLGEQISLNKKITTVSILLIMAFAAVAVPEVYAQNTNLGATISS